MADEFRAALISMGAVGSSEPHHLALALMACLMIQAGVPRSCIQHALVTLASLPGTAFKPEWTIGFMNGNYMYLPGVTEHVYRVDTLEIADDDPACQDPLVVTAFRFSAALAAVQG